MPGRSRGTKQVSGGLRMLKRHRLEICEREEQLVPKNRHERVVAAFAWIVVDEIQAFTPALPEAMMSVLAEASLKIDDRTLRLMTTQAEAQAEALRTRIADAIQASDA